MEKKTLYIVFMADVQAAQIAKLREAVTNAVNSGEYETIYILLSSGGGSVFEGLSMAAMLRSLPLNVITHNIGQIDSVAGVLFASGKERYASPNSSFLFHGVSIPINQTMIESQLFEQYQNLKRLRESIALNFSAYTGVKVEEVAALMIDGASILSPTEALSKSIVHEIKDVSIPPGANIISIGNA